MTMPYLQQYLYHPHLIKKREDKVFVCVIFSIASYMQEMCAYRCPRETTNEKIICMEGHLKSRLQCKGNYKGYIG